MADILDDEQISVLYFIRHCCYDCYPDDADVLELSNDDDKCNKGVIYANLYRRDAERVDRMMSDEDSEESFSERIKEDLARFEKEYASEDWICARIMIHFCCFS